MVGNSSNDYGRGVSENASKGHLASTIDRVYK